MLSTVTASHRRLQDELQAHLGPDVAVVCTGVDGDPMTIRDEERAGVARAIPRRQREFAAGRAAARAAMRQLGWPACAVPARPDRSPAWPEGLVGSISHTADTCVAVVAAREHRPSIGIDLEPDQGLAEDLWRTIGTPLECRRLMEAPQDLRPRLATRLFTAKEAFYKWQFPLTGQWLDFQDVSVVWNSTGDGFSVRLTRLRPERPGAEPVGQLLLCEGLVVALCFTKA